MSDNISNANLPYTKKRAGKLWRSFWDIFFILFSIFLGISLIILDHPFWMVEVVQVASGVFLTLIAPGYCFTLILFPRKQDMDIIARLTFSFGISTTLLPVLVLLLDKLGLGILPEHMLRSLVLIILITSGIASIQRLLLLPTNTAYTPPSPTHTRWWKQTSNYRKIGYGLGSLFVLGVGLVVVNTYLIPTLTMHITEFYILNAEGETQAYPRNAVMGEPLEVLMGIANREGKTRTYRVEIRVEDSLNPDRRALVKVLGPFTLADGEKREMLVSWTMPWAGKDQKVEFVLFVAGKSQPYRTLHFWLDQVAEADEQ